jgi:hypothetical protein
MTPEFIIAGVLIMANPQERSSGAGGPLRHCALSRITFFADLFLADLELRSHCPRRLAPVQGGFYKGNPDNGILNAGRLAFTVRGLVETFSRLKPAPLSFFIHAYATRDAAKISRIARDNAIGRWQDFRPRLDGAV